jgi:nitric oxide reductase NorD protein
MTKAIVKGTREPGDVSRFELLASAIAGRIVTIETTDHKGEVWTDGAAIFVNPHAPKTTPLQCVVVQAALLGAGSFDEEEVLGRLARTTKLCRRYLAVEGHRALAELEPMLPPSARRLCDPTIAALSTSPLHSLDIASGSQVLADPPEAFGMIRPRLVRRRTDAVGSDPALAPYQPRSQSRELLSELDDEVENPFEGPDFLTSPIGGGGAIGRLLKGLFRSGRSSVSGPPGADAPTHRGRRGTRASLNLGLAPATFPDATYGDAFAPRGVAYPEWDVHHGRYRPDWCTVTPVDPPPTANITFTLPDATGIRRSLSHIGVALERRRRQLQGIDIDLDAVVESRAQAMSGSVPEEAVYLDLVRGRRDLGVLILLDVSGSSGEPSAGGGTVHEHQVKAAASLTVALAELGDRVALYAFRSQGRSAVQVERMKRFDDRMDATVLRRLSASEPGAYTRLGAAIRHGTWLLTRESGVSRRLLVVLSDGFAYDHGYEGSYGEADARRALSEARRFGTGCVCLSIGASTEVAKLSRVFGTAAHASVVRFEDLPRVTAPLFRFALRSAEAQQRNSQHATRANERLALEVRSVA